MHSLFDSTFSSVTFGHLIIDLLNGQRSVLLTYWSQELFFSNTLLAFVSAIYVWVASLSQPFFGWLTDRFGARWLAAGGILWLTGFFSLGLFVPVAYAIPCLILASLGSAAFHPAGAMQATLSGQTHLRGRETTAASWFFMFGQLGYFFGPIIGGPLLEIFVPTGLLILVAPALVIGLNTAWQLRSLQLPDKTRQETETFKGVKIPARKSFLVILATMAGLQSWAQQNMVTFIPKHLSDLGQSPTVYGLMAGLFMGGSALGNLAGGNLADRFGKRLVATSMLAISVIPILLISGLGWSAWLYLLVPLAGFFTGAVHSIIVVRAQRYIRTGMALASGLTLGFMFSTGALGALLSGPLVDAFGFQVLFQMTAGLALLACVLNLKLGD